MGKDDESVGKIMLDGTELTQTENACTDLNSIHKTRRRSVDAVVVSARLQHVL
jgi:hypothetical protein